MSTARITRSMSRKNRKDMEETYNEMAREERRNCSNIMMKFMLIQLGAFIACPAFLYLMHKEISAGNYTRALGELVVAGATAKAAIHRLFKGESELDERMTQLREELEILARDNRQMRLS